MKEEVRNLINYVLGRPHEDILYDHLEYLPQDLQSETLKDLIIKKRLISRTGTGHRHSGYAGALFERMLDSKGFSHALLFLTHYRFGVSTSVLIKIIVMYPFKEQLEIVRFCVEELKTPLYMEYSFHFGEEVDDVVMETKRRCKNEEVIKYIMSLPQ